MPKTILEEAMEDAKLLKETAIENAKNVLVEAISPKIKEFVSSQLGETPPLPVTEVGPENMAFFAAQQEAGMPGMPGVPGTMPEMYEDEGALGLGNEEEEEEMEEGHRVQESDNLDEEKLDEETLDEEKVDEVVEITNEDLKTALSEVLSGIKLKEAHVSKGFGDVEAPDDGGLMDKKSGEKHWSEEEPPASQDWTVKEAAYRKQIEILKKESTKLKTENKEYKEACDFLRRNLQEVNLFNAKLLYTNKLLHSTNLNNKQRLRVVEMFDKAQSLREVELVYKSLSESLKITGVLGESKQAQQALKGSKSSRYTTSSSTLLKEAAEKENGENSWKSRMEELAGLRSLVE